MPEPRSRVRRHIESTTRTKPDGEVIRVAGRDQRSTPFREARDFLDDLGVPGGVTVWTARSQQTHVYADRRADGTWVGLDRLTGTWVPLPAAADASNSPTPTPTSEEKR